MDDSTAHTSVPVADENLRYDGSISSGHCCAFRWITYQRLAVTPAMVPMAARIRMGVPDFTFG